MLFSVVVPVYRVEEYLPACIRSVLNQTFTDFELILVDDGSPDQSGAICDEFAKKDGRIRVIHKENGGLCAARKTGIAAALGEFVLNLDSDDAIEEDTLMEAKRILDSAPCDFISFSYRWMKQGVQINLTTDPFPEGFYSEEEIREKLLPSLFMNENMEHLSYYLAGKVIRRSLLRPIQKTVSDTISLGEDFCCVVPLYLSAKGVYLSKKEAYLYSVRENSMSKEFNAGQIHLVETILSQLSKTDLSKICDLKEQLDRYFTFMCFTVFAAAAEGGHKKSVKALQSAMERSVEKERIARARFATLSRKTKISLFLMKKGCYKATFYFLYFCKIIKNLIGKG